MRDNIIVIPIYENNIRNIVIPDSTRFGKNSGRGEYRLYHGFIYGIIESVGKNYKNTFNGRLLQFGDRIIFQRNEGKKILYNQQEYLKLREKSVLAVIEGEVN